AGVEVYADTVHVIGATGGGNAGHVAVVGPGVGAVVKTSGSRRAADDHHIGVHRLNGLVGRRQHVVHIGRRVNLTGGPLEVDVHLVPDFDGIWSKSCHAAQELHVAVEVNAAGVGIGAGDAQQHF